MSDIIKSENTGLMGLFHGQGGGLSIPKPFEHDIFLFDSYVAGTTFIAGIEELEPHLNVGDRLNFFREPDNTHDKRAIVIKNTDGIKIGYVPRDDNMVFSRLMDAGKQLFAEISSKEMKGKWLMLEIKIYLHE